MSWTDIIASGQPIRLHWTRQPCSSFALHSQVGCYCVRSVWFVEHGKPFGSPYYLFVAILWQLHNRGPGKVCTCAKYLRAKGLRLPLQKFTFDTNNKQYR